MAIDHDDIQALKDYVNERDQLVKAELKMWMIRIAAVHIIPLISIVFLLGGIYKTGQNALDLLEKQGRIVQANSDWILQRDFEIRMRRDGQNVPYLPYEPARPEK